MAIYLDNQASTPLDPAVLEQMLPHLGTTPGNPHSSEHSVGWQANQVIERSLHRIGSCLNCDPDELVLTSGATESNNMAILGLLRSNQDQSRNRILVSPTEHKAVLACMSYGADRLGYKVEKLPIDNCGTVDTARSAELISDDVLLVSMMAVNNEIGTIQPVEEVSALARAKGAIYHCDGAQAPCALDLGLLMPHVDLLSLSGHKVYGPQGVGLLYGQREIWPRIEPLLFGGEQQDGRRSGTIPVALTVGLAAALEKICQDGPDQEFDRIKQLTRRLLTGLDNLPNADISLNGPGLHKRHPGNLNVRFAAMNAADLIMMLQPKIALSSGSACSSGTIEPSYVLTAIGLDREAAASSVRFSLGRFNTEDEIDVALAEIGSLTSVSPQS